MEANMAASSSRSGWGETIKIVIEALIIALIVRVFFYQPFNIPSGSMKETLLIGDYLFVSKLSYGYSRHSFPYSPKLFEGRIFEDKPERGDVAVFKLPRDNETDYIKRVVGLPGDTVEMRDGVLHLNGKAVPKKRVGTFQTTGYNGRKVSIPKFEETLPNGVTYTVLDSDANGVFDNTPPVTVPEGYYFMMGDNRDNSTDSRATHDVGLVPLENFIGRADIIFFSAAIDEPGALSWTTPWRWPFDLRWDRFFNLVR